MGVYGGYYGQPYPNPIQQLQGENYQLRENNGDVAGVGVNEGSLLGGLLGGGALGGFLAVVAPPPLKAVAGIAGFLAGGGVGAMLGDNYNEMKTTNRDAGDNGILDGSPQYGIYGGYGQQGYGYGYGQQGYGQQGYGQQGYYGYRG